jgi:hypothetical protein
MGHRRDELTAVSLLTLVSMLGLAGCGSDDDSPGGGAAQTTAETAAATTTTGQPAEPAQLADGRHPVIVKRVSVGGRTVTFDLIQWFEGDVPSGARIAVTRQTAGQGG